MNSKPIVKLTPEQRAAMVAAYETGTELATVIAARFGVSECYPCQLTQRERRRRGQPPVDRRRMQYERRRLLSGDDLAPMPKKRKKQIEPPPPPVIDGDEIRRLLKLNMPITMIGARLGVPYRAVMAEMDAR